MEKTFTLQQVKKLIVTTVIITTLVVWLFAKYWIPKMEEQAQADRMQSNTKAIIGNGEVH